MKHQLIILVFALLGCNSISEKKKELQTPVDRDVESRAVELSAEDIVVRKIGLDPKEIYRYEVVTVEEFPVNLNRRSQVRIIVPEGLSRIQLSNTFKKAILDHFVKLNTPKALSILAYREGDNTKGAYTVGKMDFAPYGDWGNKNYGNYDNYDLDISIYDTYFKPKPALKTESPVHTVYNATKYVTRNGRRVEVPATTVDIFSEPGNLTAETKIGEIPNNSKVEIIDTFSESLAQGYSWTAYKVKYKNMTGWVLDSKVK